MKNKAQYFKIGLFIVSGFFLFVAGVIIFGAGLFDNNKIMFETYFDESVQGLSEGAPVKYRGVQIGVVEEITFVGDEYPLEEEMYYKCGRYVMVKMAISRDIMGNEGEEQIKAVLKQSVEKSGLRLRLAYQGVTGLAYLEADFVDVSTADPIFTCWEPRTNYLPSFPNTIARMEESVNDLMRSLDKDVFPMLENISEASKSIPELTLRLNETLANLNNILTEQKESFGLIVNNIETATNDFKELMVTLKKYPSQIIFGGKPPKSQFE